MNVPLYRCAGAAALSMLVALLAPTTASAADSRPDFAKLREQRAQLTAEIERLRAQIKTQRDVKSIPIATLEGHERTAVKDRESLSTRIVELKRRPNPDPAQIKGLDAELRRAEEYEREVKEELQRRRDTEAKISSLEEDLSKKQLALSNLDTRINEAIESDREAQNFKKIMSSIFAALVGIVIAAFFGIAFYDEIIRRTIFSGQAGIQFVTLFSLVIAIILFGITGILADKELAALLGGLSGYILGRATTSRGTGEARRAAGADAAARATSPDDAHRAGPGAAPEPAQTP